MSVNGKIKSVKVLTLEENLKIAREESSGLDSYVIQKHKLAEDNNRYVVELEVEEPGFDAHYVVVRLFLPKGIIDNNLIETDTIIQCDSSSCHLDIAGVEDWFDRAYNGAQIINDTQYK